MPADTYFGVVYAIRVSPLKLRLSCLYCSQKPFPRRHTLLSLGVIKRLGARYEDAPPLAHFHFKLMVPQLPCNVLTSRAPFVDRN